MNAATSTLGQGSYSTLPSTLTEKLAKLLHWPVAIAAIVAALYLVFVVYTTGQAAWAAGLLVLFTAGFYVYLSRGGFAWRYLFPGIAGMLIFIAFPLVYTAQIGFTNYSSTHLLSESRVREYLLEQRDAVEDQVLAYSLHASGAEYRLVLHAEGEAAPQWVSPPLALRSGKGVRVDATAADAASTPTDAALPLPELIKHRDALSKLVLVMPDKTELHYLGLREFGPVKPQWTANADGSLTRTADNTAFKPNRDTGFFESTSGEVLQPGFKAFIGAANYARMLFDAEFRGPFLSIFTWTVLFSALTVFFATAIGMLFAVMLNWEGMKYRTTYRTLLFLPYAVPGFISILVFKGLFNQNFGEINAILNALFGVKPAWFADPLLAKTMLVIVNVWLGYPYVMILCSGLLKAIPADLYEASALAGASPATNFFKITAPLIIKPLAPLLVSAFAFNFNNFVLIALLTDGRPDFLSTKLPAGQTDILVSYTYRIAFRDSGSDFGLAAAISTLIFFLVAALSLINLRLSAKAQR
ncbi:maltose/maltodextrin transport system permease protein [Pelomonas saccharophila]|uniref:Maltose/maltodextrin transport system permease protein n=1 Tax=Roseateles saccharophilus TaxID=304 RepID=A0ABU1YFQ1_ROSSA|nr:maltose ABC transporter permease MalF [Roseateles saccharophilus]MDR7267679.1 maltose/maltodextrin transport system permease protein [Roseateles saccharophilus]